MMGFFNSPYSVPISIVAIIFLSSTIKTIVKARYQERNTEEEKNRDGAYRNEIDELRRRVENLETIVLELERKSNRI